MLTNPATSSALYMACVILDEFDGWAARKFDQCTTFGAALDIAIDLLVSQRGSRVCLCCFSTMLPQY